jgi:5'-methylthioadenosine phosphorylase
MLAIIGGTGLYELAGMQITNTHDEATPFGEPSGTIVQGRLNGRELLFLARHGKGHKRLPHEVNYRANVFALKRAGATMIVGFSAVGSLAADVHPGDLALPAQYVDWTRGRRTASFFGDGVAAHVSTAEPVSAALAGWIARQADAMAIPIHRGLTYGCVEGPRLGTRAESHFLRGAAGCQLVGMTNVPEVFLAREAQIAYASICIVTDYDCWMDDPSQHASVQAILQRYAASLTRARVLLDALLAGPLPEPEAAIRTALLDAMITPDAALSAEQRAWLDVLRR